jgi:hypothetical protein
MFWFSIQTWTGGVRPGAAESIRDRKTDKKPPGMRISDAQGDLAVNRTPA